MFKKGLSFFIACIMLYTCVIANVVTVQAESGVYVALGDSICRGYGLNDAEGERYSSLLAKNLDYTCINYGVDGMTSAEMLAELQKGSYDIANADVITVSIGSNDLLSPLIAIIAEVLGVKVDSDVAQNISATLMQKYQTNQVELLANIAAIKERLNNNETLNQACVDFASNFDEIISAIREQNPNCEIYVTNVYNPYYDISINKDYGTFVYEIINLGSICDEYVSKINTGFDSGDYKLVDVYSAFNVSGLTNATKSAEGFTGAESDITGLDIDPHPNSEGQYAIYSAIKTAMTSIWGDVDGDGLLTASDAALVLQKVLDKESVTINDNVAIVSGGSVLSAEDAAMILQKVLNSSFVLPVEKTSVTQTTTETTTEATTETVSETTTEATTETVSETTTEATTETISETTTEATTETISETTTEITTETVSEATTEVTTEFNRDMYSLTGFGNANTGGGVIDENSSAYVKVSNVKEFSAAITAAKKGTVKVIEITADLGLGSIEIGGSYSNISEHSVQPSKHPTLMKTGISSINLNEIDGLTIFSKNGATLKHGAFSIKNSSNIVIRNLTFDELWEWDESTKALYKKNDWDYMTVESSQNVWVDHCTFHKSYDGVVDAKRNVNGLTISWCYFPEDDMGEGSFVRTQIDYLENNMDSYSYYKKVRTEYGFTKEEVIEQCAGHDKTHLLGSSELDSNNQNLQVTMYNNYYENCQQRMPRLRSGNVHVFNTVIDSERNYNLLQRLSDKFALVNTSSEGFHIVSDGCVSTEDGALLVENSNFIGVADPLCNNKKGATKTDYTGKIKAVNMLYQLGDLTYLGGSDDADSPIAIAPADIKEFSWNGFTELPYSYVKADPTSLKALLLGENGCGSGKSGIGENEWLEVKYQ